MSSPGMAKTYIITEFMKEKGRYKPPFVLSQRMPFEVSGMGIPNHNIGKMQYYDFDFLLELKDGDILFIDETFNANPLTLSAFLTFLESRIMISGKKLPDIMIVAAANPQGMPVLTPQIRRRFLQYDIIFDAQSWKDYLFNKYYIPGNVASILCSLVNNQDTSFPGYNYNTPADLDKAIYMVAKNVPTPYDNVVKPILDTLISNPLEGEIILPDGTKIEENEQFACLKLIKLKLEMDEKIRK
jgi:hypothetical protein